MCSLRANGNVNDHSDSFALSAKRETSRRNVTPLVSLSLSPSLCRIYEHVRESVRAWRATAAETRLRGDSPVHSDRVSRLNFFFSSLLTLYVTFSKCPSFSFNHFWPSLIVSFRRCELLFWLWQIFRESVSELQKLFVGFCKFLVLKFTQFEEKAIQWTQSFLL